MPISLYNHQSLKNRRRFLRKRQTPEESIIWERLRNRKVHDSKFFRQHSIGPYITDFYCPKLRLAIEIDGSQHVEEKTKVYDAERERYLFAHNIRTIRFRNSEVKNEINKVLEKIKEAIESQPLVFPSLIDKRGAYSPPARGGEL